MVRPFDRWRITPVWEEMSKFRDSRVVEGEVEGKVGLAFDTAVAKPQDVPVIAIWGRCTVSQSCLGGPGPRGRRFEVVL